MTISTLLSLGAAPLAAPPMHEGHGRAEWQSTWLHWVLEPEHAIPGIAAIGVVALLVVFARRRARAALERR